MKYKVDITIQGIIDIKVLEPLEDQESLFDNPNMITENQFNFLMRNLANFDSDKVKRLSKHQASEMIAVIEKGKRVIATEKLEAIGKKLRGEDVDRLCKVVNCSEKKVAKGLCKSHYQEEYRNR